MWLWLMWSLSLNDQMQRKKPSQTRIPSQSIWLYMNLSLFCGKIWILHNIRKGFNYIGDPFNFNSLMSTYESKQTLTLNCFLNGLQGYTSTKQWYQFIFSPIPLGPICLNSLHFNCWPHEDQSKRIPFFAVAQNHAAALYRIKSLDIKHITDWGGKAHHACTAQSVVSIFSCPCQYGLMWIIYIRRTNF